MRGMLGPVRSISSTPTLKPLCTRLRASCVVTDDLPTPPFPESTSTICFICARFVARFLSAIVDKFKEGG